MDNLIKIAQDSMWVKPEVPSFKSGDTITVTYKIVEGNKERLQSFRGTVIQIKGSGSRFVKFRTVLAWNVFFRFTRRISTVSR